MEFDPSKMKTESVKRKAPEQFEFDPSKQVQTQIEKPTQKSTTKRALEPEQQFGDFDIPSDLGQIKAWSFSSLKKFEQCPAAIKYNKIDKIVEPSSEAMERGSAIHLEAEQYIRGEIEELPKSLNKFPEMYQWMRDKFAAGEAIVEEDWGFRIDWSECGFYDDDVWHRAKLDVLIFEGDNSATIIDHKTGRKFGNETKHAEQGLLYVVDTFLKYPELDTIKYIFVYVDKGETLERTLSREQALRFHALWHNRGLIMTTATVFDYLPSAYNCKWCHYGKEGICPNAWTDAS